MSIRVGLIGSGVIGRYHIDQLKKVEEAQIVSVCDIDESRARQLAEPIKAKVYTDHKKMYDREQLNAVFIGIPPFAHTDQETLAAERGIHLFVQKPPALTMEKAKEVEAAIKKHKVISAVGFQDRYLDIIDGLKEYLVGKKVGTIMGYWMGGIYGVPWWRVKAQSGGQPVEQTIHIFDMVRYLFGDVKAVYAAAGSGIVTGVENYDIEDCSAVTLKFNAGPVAVIFSACYIKTGGKGGVDIFCEDARVEYALRSNVKYMEKNKVTEVRVGNDNSLLCVKTFLDAIKTGDASKIRSPYSDGVKSLALPVAANKSMATGKEVKV